MTEWVSKKGRAYPMRDEDACEIKRILTVRWLWMNWEGTPWLKRLRLRSPLYLKPLPGCGCVVPLKSRWQRMKAALLNKLVPYAKGGS